MLVINPASFQNRPHPPSFQISWCQNKYHCQTRVSCSGHSPLEVDGCDPYHYLFPFRYSHSLPRRNRLYSQSTTQSSQKPPNRRSYHSPQRRTSQFQTGVHSYSTPYKDTNYKQLPSGMTPIDNQVIYSNHEDTTLTDRYTAAREGQNHNRELYASSNPQPLRADTLELDFYSTISRHATPYKPISVSTTHNYHTPAITRQSHSAGRSGKRSNNSTYSEDEGVVMTSESDSSVSQYPTYENRDSILAARQRPLSNGRFPTNAEIGRAHV